MRTKVFLVNFGGPRTLDDVPLFMRGLSGREPEPAALEAVTDRYRRIGGGSPLAAITEEQAALLSAASGLSVGCAFRYSSPTLEEAINECYRSAVERVVFFVMSPYYTSRTAGAYERTALSYLSLLPYRPEISFIDSWYGEPSFRDAWVEMIREKGPGEGSFYLFSAHSLPLSMADEPYKGQVEETVSHVAGRLGLAAYALGWQSAPQSDEPWIGPTVEAVIEGLPSGTRKIVQVPIGFTADHLETLYDIDIVHAACARSKGLAFSRIPSLNTYPPFIAALKTILASRLGTGL